MSKETGVQYTPFYSVVSSYCAFGLGMLLTSMNDPINLNTENLFVTVTVAIIVLLLILVIIAINAHIYRLTRDMDGEGEQ